MAFSNIDANALPLGKILQIAFSDGIRNQISTDFRDFEMVKRAKVSGSLPRELRFMFQTSLGAAAIQYANPGAGAGRRNRVPVDAPDVPGCRAVLRTLPAGQ